MSKYGKLGTFKSGSGCFPKFHFYDVCVTLFSVVFFSRCYGYDKSYEFCTSYVSSFPLSLFEPRQEKIFLRGMRPDKTKTGLLSYRD